MNWFEFLKTHPGDVLDVVRLAIQIAHKLIIKRRKRRLAQRIKKAEEERQYPYRIPKSDDLK